MFELYDYSVISLYFNSYLKVMFNISIILLTIFLIASLVMWLVGVKLKSEKTIKKGMRLTLIMIFLLVLMFGMIIMIANLL